MFRLGQPEVVLLAAIALIFIIGPARLGRAIGRLRDALRSRPPPRPGPDASSTPRGRSDRGFRR